MRIRKVQLEGDVDEFGGRALAVSTTSDVGTIRTPNRALTSTEFQYKAKLPFSPALNNDVSEIVHQLHGKRWTQFMSTNGSFYNIKKSLDSFAAKMAYTVKRYYPQIKFGTPISDEAIHQMIMLQRSGELDFISMPSIPPSQMFEKTATSFIEEALSENEEPMVYLDMGLDPKIFQERFSALLEFVHTGQIHSIGLIYRSWHKNIRNYEYLWKNREVEVFLQMSEIPRRTSGTPQLTSTMHLLQKFGIDSFSVKLAQSFGSGKVNKEKDKLNSFQTKSRFDTRPLIFRQFREWTNHDESLDCDCPICKGKNASEFMDAYYGEHENYAGATLNAANNLHEYYCSTDEFKQSRKYIIDGELKYYFKSKDGLKSSDIPILKTILDF